MSTRTIIEINHDYLSDLFEDRTFLRDFVQWLSLADIDRAKAVGLSVGIRILGQRHHSEPEWKQG